MAWMTDRDGRCVLAVLAVTAIIMLPLACGCTQEMYDQPRTEPMEPSDFFRDGKSTRLPVRGTVARGRVYHETDPYFTGQVDGQPVETIPDDPRNAEPFDLTRGVLQRGQQRFNIYCSICHARTGYGDGIIVRHGFQEPPSLHEARLRENTADGHFFDVITNGFRTMPAQGDRIPAEDRWAIVAYLRVLQHSQHVELDNAPADIRAKFSNSSSNP